MTVSGVLSAVTLFGFGVAGVGLFVVNIRVIQQFGVAWWRVAWWKKLDRWDTRILLGSVVAASIGTIGIFLRLSLG